MGMTDTICRRCGSDFDVISNCKFCDQPLKFGCQSCGNIAETFWSNMMSPYRMTETYVKMVSRLAENTITATKLSNNMFIANMEALKTLMQQAKDHVKEISRLTVSNAKTFEQIVAGEYVKSSD